MFVDITFSLLLQFRLTTNILLTRSGVINALPRGNEVHE